MDEMIYKTQVWLNETYGGKTGYNSLNLDNEKIAGKTNWTTIYALTRALQIELGITSTADNFGNTTISKFKSRFPNGISQQAEDSTEEDNIYAIIQGALWCKGYSAVYGAITKQFKSSVASSIKKMKADAGLSNANATISVDLMKALLSMDQFVLLSSYGGTSEIRTIQQTLNGNYANYVGIIPCDGVYGRSLNKALVKVLQALEGLSPSQANGNFGPTTTAKITKLIANSKSSGEYVKLMRYALACNGYSTGSFLNTWDSKLENSITEFQGMYALPITKIGDKNTWMSLLTSKGNPDRSSTACDCSTILNSNKATALYDAGYRYVGRYLTGTVGGTTSKAMTRDEIKSIFAAGLNIFPIFQEGTPSLDRYTKEEGLVEGKKAYKAALALGIPQGTIIYFAIDYDVTDAQVTYVKNYFKGINQIFNQSNFYQVGIYGPRNVCSKVCTANLAKSSFVSDMSTGFSGNLGYPIPDNWAFDQFDEYTFTSGNASFGLDKDAFSGRDKGFSMINETTILPDLSMYERVLMAKRFFANFGINLLPNMDLLFNVSYTADFGNMEITYSFSEKKKDDSSDANVSTTIDVINGSVSESVSNVMGAAYGGLGNEYTVDIGFDSVTTMMGLVSTIENGSIAVRGGMDSTGCFVMKYEVEQIVREDDDTKYYQYYEVECKFKPYEKDDTSTQPEYSFEKAYDINWGEVGVAIAAVAVVFVAVVAVVGSYGTAAPAAAAMLSVAANLAYAYN